MDWLERGHGGGDGLRPMIKGSTGRADDRVSIRSVLRGGDVRSPRKPRRRTKALVGWLLYCCTAVGGTAAAFTVRDTLFPQLGGRSNALWVSPAKVPLTTEHGAPSREGDDSMPSPIAPVVAAPATTQETLSVDDQNVPSALSPDADQATADNHGPSANAGPTTGTNVDHDPAGVHGTIVDENPVGTSNSVPGSSTSVDPTSTAVSSPGSSTSSTTTPADATSGKGGSGGGSGTGGGSDGVHSTDPPTP